MDTLPERARARGGRARRDTEDESIRHDRWLVSYADFVTLLLAVFVVLYAFASSSEGKYRVLSETVTAAFRHDQAATATATTAVRAPGARLEAEPKPPPSDSQGEAQEQSLRGIAGDIEEAMGSLLQSGQARLMQTPRGLAVEINASVLFAPAHATLEPAAIVALEAVAAILRGIDNGIEVQGHTDHVPIATAQYPSNWELASARASAVVRLFAASGVAASRLPAVGYADNRPVEASDSAEARARNRRVTLLILADEAPRKERPASPAAPAQAR